MLTETIICVLVLQPVEQGAPGAALGPHAPPLQTVAMACGAVVQEAHV